MRFSVLMASMMSRALAFSPLAIEDGGLELKTGGSESSDVASGGESSFGGSDWGGGLFGGASKSER
jgi:hypothetical protein